MEKDKFLAVFGILEQRRYAYFRDRLEVRQKYQLRMSNNMRLLEASLDDVRRIIDDLPRDMSTGLISLDRSRGTVGDENDVPYNLWWGIKITRFWWDFQQHLESMMEEELNNPKLRWR